MSAESWRPSACMRSRTGLRTSSGRGKDHRSSASSRSARTSNGALRIFAGTLLRTVGSRAQARAWSWAWAWARARCSCTRAAMSRVCPSPRGKCPDTRHRMSAESWRPSACMRSRTGLRTSSGRGKDHRSSASSRSARTSNGTLRIFAGTLLRTVGSRAWAWGKQSWAWGKQWARAWAWGKQWARAWARSWAWGKQWARAWGMHARRPRDRSSPSCRTARRGRDCQRWPGKSRRRKARAGTCR